MNSEEVSIVERYHPLPWYVEETSCNSIAILDSNGVIVVERVNPADELNEVDREVMHQCLLAFEAAHLSAALDRNRFSGRASRRSG